MSSRKDVESSNEALPPSSTDVRLRDLPPKERELQKRYWGITSDMELARCPICSKQGHMPPQCRARDCPYCGVAGDHFPSDCPKIQKCSRCQERGHGAFSCPSKLARSAADGFDCDLCHGNHKEDRCSWLWRTFRPSETLTKVATLPIFCYVCASTAHWGDDCHALPAIRPDDVSTNDVFSASFANQFLDNPIDSEISVRGSTQNNPQANPQPSASSANPGPPKNQPLKQPRREIGHPGGNSDRDRRNYRAVPPPKSLEARIKGRNSRR